MMVASTGIIPRVTTADAEKCPELRIIFARGSGADYTGDKNYDEFRKTIEAKLLTTEINYEFINLDYPAVGVGIDNLSVTLGALFGAGEAYEFGASVKSGVKKLDNIINSSSCPETKYVIGGYSQGAMVVSRALGSLNADKIIYAATFGDPKLYLPEGKGIIPAACRGENLSDYRMYVPDCQAYKGLLGAYIPYEPKAYVGKVGTWCNKADIFCSSRFNMDDHLAYVAEGLYEDAARVIFDKIAKEFGVENKISSPHDTAILIDTTGSMEILIEKYQAEALRLAEETLASGGRVALYSYRDIKDRKLPIEHCSFESCTLEVFREQLYGLKTAGGGEPKESLLSGALNTMRSLNWKRGATKSLVILTDNGFHNPDLDGTTVMDVIKLSREIDPVAIYVVGDPAFTEHYAELTTETGGRFISINGDLAGLTDEIMVRYESLARVEEAEADEEAPEISIEKFGISETGEIQISFSSTAEKVMVILNEYILGLTEGHEITILADPAEENMVTLVPYNSSRRGESIEISFLAAGKGGDSFEAATLLAPNTGRK